MSCRTNESAVNSACTGELHRALEKLELEVRAGLLHGFFELEVAGEVIKDRKRRLVIRAGKSFQFIIPEHEIKREQT